MCRWAAFETLLRGAVQNVHGFNSPWRLSANVLT
jgi:hypothetical protein